MTYLCQGREDSERFRMHEIYGDCLEKAGIYMPEGAIATVDSNAEIEVGDLIICSRIVGQARAYIKKVKEIIGDSIIVGTKYRDPSKNFTFEAAEIMGVVKEIYRKDTGKRIYARSEQKQKTSNDNEIVRSLKDKISQLEKTENKDWELWISKDTAIAIIELITTQADELEMMRTQSEQYQKRIIDAKSICYHFFKEMERAKKMKISQLISVIDKDEEIVIKDVNVPVNRNRVYQGTVEGIKRDETLNSMHVVIIFPEDNKLMVLAKKADRGKETSE